jgi:hypothetical protein
MVGASALLCAGAIAAGQQGRDLKPVAAFARIADQRARSVALFREMGKVIQHPRCLNCHPRGDRPTQTEAMLPHSPPVLRGATGDGVPGLECATCHGGTNAAFATQRGSVPGDPHWKLAPIEMAWQGYSLGHICRQISDPARNGGRSLDKIVDHMADDHLVGWGWRPGPGRIAAPGTQAQFGRLARAWVDSGAHCPS